MKFIDQNRFSNHEGTEHGNCFIACLASLMGIEIDDLKELEISTHNGNGEWHQPFFDAVSKNGFSFEGMCSIADFSADWWVDLLKESCGVDGYFIVGGGSPRGFRRGHAVIYKDGEMVHDPHPDRTGLTDIQEIYLIEKLEK